MFPRLYAPDSVGGGGGQGGALRSLEKCIMPCIILMPSEITLAGTRAYRIGNWVQEVRTRKFVTEVYPKETQQPNPINPTQT